MSGRHILLGDDGEVSVTARQSQQELRTEVRLARRGTRLTIGHVLPAGAKVSSVRLDGKRVDSHIVDTARGRELVTTTGTPERTSWSYAGSK